MKKLEQRQEGRYFLNGIEVTPQLVYGPIINKYKQIIDCTEIPIGALIQRVKIDDLIQRIKRETGVDLEQIANSYHSGGIKVIPDPENHPEKAIRHDIFFFFNSQPKPCN